MKSIFFCFFFFTLFSCTSSKVVSETEIKKKNTTAAPINNNGSNSKNLIYKDVKSLKNNDLIPGRSEEISNEINPINKKEQTPSRNE
jgi:hypothetical protein